MRTPSLLSVSNFAPATLFATHNRNARRRAADSGFGVTGHGMPVGLMHDGNMNSSMTLLPTHTPPEIPKRVKLRGIAQFAVSLIVSISVELDFHLVPFRLRRCRTVALRAFHFSAYHMRWP